MSTSRDLDELEHRASAPMSPPPPPLDPPPQYGRRRDDTLSGYRPADDDESERAYRWRSRKGLQVARRSEALAVKAIGLGEQVLERFTAADAKWSARWATLAKIGWPVLIALCVAGALGAAGGIIHCASTLHH